jgi:hypothetical protein
MPPYAGQIPEEDVLKIIAYIKSLAETTRPAEAVKPEYDADIGTPPAAKESRDE